MSDHTTHACLLPSRSPRLHPSLMRQDGIWLSPTLTTQEIAEIGTLCNPQALDAMVRAMLQQSASQVAEGAA